MSLAQKEYTFGKVCDVEEIPVLDWDNHRAGRLLGKVRMTFPSFYAQEMKHDALGKLVRHLQLGEPLPSEATIVDFLPPGYTYQLESLNLRLRDDNSIGNDPLIFVMGQMNRE